jgi:hypothetical protein
VEPLTPTKWAAGGKFHVISSRVLGLPVPSCSLDGLVLSELQEHKEKSLAADASVHLSTTHHTKFKNANIVRFKNPIKQKRNKALIYFVHIFVGEKACLWTLRRDSRFSFSIIIGPRTA